MKKNQESYSWDVYQVKFEGIDNWTYPYCFRSGIISYNNELYTDIVCCPICRNQLMTISNESLYGYCSTCGNVANSQGEYNCIGESVAAARYRFDGNPVPQSFNLYVTESGKIEQPD